MQVEPPIMSTPAFTWVMPAPLAIVGPICAVKTMKLWVQVKTRGAVGVARSSPARKTSDVKSESRMRRVGRKDMATC